MESIIFTCILIFFILVETITHLIHNQLFILTRVQENNNLNMNHPIREDLEISEGKKKDKVIQINAVGNEDYTGLYDSNLGQSIIYGSKKICIHEIYGEVERFLLKNEKNRNVYIDIKKDTYSYFDGSQIINERMDTYLENIVKPRYKRMYEFFKKY